VDFKRVLLEKKNLKLLGIHIIVIILKVMDNPTRNQKIVIIWISIKLIYWILLHRLVNHHREYWHDMCGISYF
jgi:hypothetical protein